MCRIYLICNKNRFIQGDPDQSLSLATRHFNFSLNLFFHKFLRFIYLTLKTWISPPLIAGIVGPPHQFDNGPIESRLKIAQRKKHQPEIVQGFFRPESTQKIASKLSLFSRSIHSLSKRELIARNFPPSEFQSWRKREQQKNTRKSEKAKKQGHFKMFYNAHSITRQTCG